MWHVMIRTIWVNWAETRQTIWYVEQMTVESESELCTRPFAAAIVVVVDVIIVVACIDGLIRHYS